MISRSVFRSSLAEELVDGLPISRWVMMDLLTLADEDGCYGSTRRALARRINTSLAVLDSALEVLGSPDPRSRSQELDGRRVVPLVDMGRGWRVVNYGGYRAALGGASRVVSKRIFDGPLSDRLHDGLPICRWVMMDLLLLADDDGLVCSTVEALARRINLPVEKIGEVLEELAGVEGPFRIEPVPGGWRVRAAARIERETRARSSRCSRAATRDSRFFRADSRSVALTEDEASFRRLVRVAWVAKSGKTRGFTGREKELLDEWQTLGITALFAAEVIRQSDISARSIVAFDEVIRRRWTSRKMPEQLSVLGSERDAQRETRSLSLKREEEFLSKREKEVAARASPDPGALAAVWRTFLEVRRRCLEGIGQEVGPCELTVVRAVKVVEVMDGFGRESVTRALGNLPFSHWHCGTGKFEGEGNRLVPEAVFRANQVEILLGSRGSVPVWEQVSPETAHYMWLNASAWPAPEEEESLPCVETPADPEPEAEPSPAATPGKLQPCVETSINSAPTAEAPTATPEEFLPCVETSDEPEPHSATQPARPLPTGPPRAPLPREPEPMFSLAEMRERNPRLWKGITGRPEIGGLQARRVS